MNARRDANRVTVGLAASTTDGAVLPLKVDSASGLLAHINITTSAGTAPTKVRRDLNFKPAATGWNGSAVRPISVDSRNGYIHANVALKPDIETLSGRTTYVFQYNNVLWSSKPSNVKVLQKSTDGGATWTDLKTFIYNVGMIIVTADGSVLVEQDADNDASTTTSTTASEFYRSTDGGVTFGGSPVLTFTNAGGAFPFSFDVKDNTIILAEYGKYNAPYVYKSTDSGATWSTIFTHPDNGTSATAHIHEVHIDTQVADLYYVSHGDNSGSRGIWYTLNGGTNWTRLTASTDWQPTSIVDNGTYVFFGQDSFHGGSKIHRVLKSKITGGTFVQATDFVEVYSAINDTRGNYAYVSYYAGGIDNNGIIYFGALSYGANNSVNNEDALLVASADDGENWYIIRNYSVLPTSSVGCTFIAKIGNDNKLYITNNGTTRSAQAIDTFTVKRYIQHLS